MSVRLPKAKAAMLLTYAKAFHLSRSEFIARAIQRCLVDGLIPDSGKKLERAIADGRPPALLVNLSNILVEIAFVLQELTDLGNPETNHSVMGQANRAHRLKQAAELLKDAQEKLVIARRDLQC